MICEPCRGRGLILDKVTLAPRPCPQCGGCGVAHCCDGDQPSIRDWEVEGAGK